MNNLEKLKKILQAKPKQFCWIISILISFVAAWESRKIIFKMNSSINDKRVLVAARELEVGHTLSLVDLKIVPEADIEIPYGKKILTDQEISFIEGSRLIIPLKQGTPITVDAMSTSLSPPRKAQVPVGHRAYFLETDGLEVVFPGAKVDLILKPMGENKDSLILVENALILDVERGMNRPGVIIALKPEEIEWIEQNLRWGRIVLALRNPKETATRRASKKGKQETRKRVKVEIITEGT